MADRKTIQLPTRKLTVELNIKPSGRDFPRDHKKETFDDMADRWFRKRMREGGAR